MPDPKKPIEKVGKDGSKVINYGDRVEMYDPAGKLISKKNIYKQNGRADQQLIASRKGSILPNHDYGEFSTQPATGTGGYYKPRSGKDLDMDDFKKRHGEFINSKYDGGYSAFEKQLADKKTAPGATLWFQKAADDELIRQGQPRYFTGTDDKSAYATDGKFGANTWAVPSLNRPAPDPVLQDAPKKEDTPKTPADDKAPPSDNGWWRQDKNNLLTAVTDQVNKYSPMLQQVDLQAPDYSLLDPSRQIAAVQEGAARFQDLAMNTAEGSVARANVLAHAGESGRQVADIISQYENQNVQISNQAAQQGAQIHNQEVTTNAGYLDKFIGETAVMGQNYDNARRDRKYRINDAMNQGITNAQKQTQLEQVLPQVHVDRNTGRMEFSGNGKDLMGDEAYPGAAQIDSQGDAATEAYMEAYERALGRGLSPDAAEKLALRQVDAYIPKNSRGEVPLNPRQRQASQMFQNSGGRGGSSSARRTYHLGGEVLPDFSL